MDEAKIEQIQQDMIENKKPYFKLQVWTLICLKLGYLRYYDDPVTGERTFRKVPEKGTEEYNKIVEIFEKCKQMQNETETE
jgi:hypothetical protein